MRDVEEVSIESGGPGEVVVWKGDDRQPRKGAGHLFGCVDADKHT